MCCIHGICILSSGANVSANLIFYPVRENGICKDLSIVVALVSFTENLSGQNRYDVLNSTLFADKFQKLFSQESMVLFKEFFFYIRKKKSFKNIFLSLRKYTFLKSRFLAVLFS